MLIDIYIILLLFLVGLFLGEACVILGLKGPKHKKEYFNKCDHCDYKYKWYELIPVFSYVIKKGSCSYCHRKSSFWYPILELVCGILFSLSFIIYGLSYEMIVMLLIVILGVIIFVSDFKYFIILDKPLIIFSIMVLILKYAVYGFETLVLSVCSGILIFIFMIAIRFIANLIFKRDSLGGGDIKLGTFFGFVVAIRLSIVSLCLGAFLAFPYAIYYAILDKQKEIPFGPFLILGLYTVFVLMEQINSLIAIVF